MKPCSWGLATVMLGSLGCASEYVPARPYAPLVMTPDHFLKDGKKHSRDTWGTNLVSLTDDVPVAKRYAETAKTEQRLALVMDLLGLLAGLATIPAVASEDKKFNGPWTQVFLNTSIAFSILGPVFHVRSAGHELDAVNAYNDAKAEPPPPPDPATSADAPPVFSPLRPEFAVVPTLSPSSHVPGGSR